MGLLNGAPSKRHRRKPNDREILFAIGIAQGKTRTDAYEAAGYTRDDGNATRLALNPTVQAEIERQRSRLASRQEMTVEWWREQYIATWHDSENESVESRWRGLEIGAKVLGLYDSQQPIHPQAQALIAALAEGLARSRNTEAPKLPEAQKSPIHGAYQVLETKDDKGSGGKRRA